MKEKKEERIEEKNERKEIDDILHVDMERGSFQIDPKKFVKARAFG